MAAKSEPQFGLCNVFVRYQRGEVLSESFGWKEVEEMQVEVVAVVMVLVVLMVMVVVLAYFTAYFLSQLVTLKDQTPCHVQSIPPPPPDSPSTPSTSTSPSAPTTSHENPAAAPLSAAFPCQLPFYGDAACSLLQVRSCGHTPSRARVLLTTTVMCLSSDHIFFVFNDFVMVH